MHRSSDGRSPGHQQAAIGVFLPQPPPVSLRQKVVGSEGSWRGLEPTGRGELTGTGAHRSRGVDGDWSPQVRIPLPVPRRGVDGDWSPQVCIPLPVARRGVDGDWSPQVFIPLLLARIPAAACSCLKTDGSTSQETPPSSYVQEQRAAPQRSPATTLLWTPSPPLTTTPRTNGQTPINRRNAEGGGKQLVTRVSVHRKAGEGTSMAAPFDPHAAAVKWGKSPPRRPFLLLTWTLAGGWGWGGGAEKLAYAKLIQNKRGFSVGGRVEAKRGEKRAHAHKVSVPAPLVEKVAMR